MGARSNMYRTVLLACACIATAVQASPDPSASLPASRSSNSLPSADSALSSSQRTVVEALVQDEMKRRRIPGLQIAIVRHGRIVFDAAYGTADIETGRPVTRDSLFTLNSSTKSFTGVAIMQLVQAGKLSLDAPVSRYIADWPSQWGTISVRQLLTHVSGLPDVLEQPKGQGTGNLIGDGDEVTAWAAVKARPVEAGPGTRFRYNQTNYVLLGKIIDKLSGTPFTQYMRTQEFDPVGASHFAFGETRDVIPGRVRIYRYANGAVDGSTKDAALEHAFDEFAPFMRTAGGLNGSAIDVARWLIGLQNGTLLDHASLTTMWTAGRYADGKPTQWGMGWPLRPDARHPVATGIGGRRSAFFVYPEDDLAIVVLTNLAGANPEEFIAEIAGAFYPELRLVNGGGLSPAANQLRVALAAAPDTPPETTYARLKRIDASFIVSEDELNDWGGRLLGAGMRDDGLRVFLLNTRLHPDSANTWDSLGEAYEARREPAEAIAAYRQSLKLDGSNEHAKAHLRMLGTGVAD